MHDEAHELADVTHRASVNSYGLAARYVDLFRAGARAGKGEVGFLVGRVCSGNVKVTSAIKVERLGSLGNLIRCAA